MQSILKTTIEHKKKLFQNNLSKMYMIGRDIFAGNYFDAVFFLYSMVVFKIDCIKFILFFSI